MTRTHDAEAYEICRALGDALRADVCHALDEGPATTAALAEAAGAPAATVHQAVAVLRRAGLVESTVGRRGRPSVHRLVRAAFGPLVDAVESLADLAKDLHQPVAAVGETASGAVRRRPVHLTEAQARQARQWRAQGMTAKAVATRLGCSTWLVWRVTREGAAR